MARMIIYISKCLPLNKSNFGIISTGSFPFFIFLSAIKTCKEVQLWETKIQIAKKRHQICLKQVLAQMARSQVLALFTAFKHRLIN